MYDLNTSIEEKIDIISKEIYGADGIELSEEAKRKVSLYEKQVTSILSPAYIRDLEISRSVSQRLNIRFRQMPTLRVCRQVSKFQSATLESLEARGSSLC